MKIREYVSIAMKAGIPEAESVWNVLVERPGVIQGQCINCGKGQYRRMARQGL